MKPDKEDPTALVFRALKEPLPAQGMEFCDLVAGSSDGPGSFRASSASFRGKPCRAGTQEEGI